MVFVCCFVRRGNKCSYVLPFLELLACNLVVIMGGVFLVMGCECNLDPSTDDPALVSQYPVDPIVMYTAIGEVVLFVLMVLASTCYPPDNLWIAAQSSSTTGNVTIVTTTAYQKMHNLEEHDAWWTVYARHWFVSLLKVGCLVFAIVLLGLYNPDKSKCDAECAASNN
jgi:hypothetical protein